MKQKKMPKYLVISTLIFTVTKYYHVKIKITAYW